MERNKYSLKTLDKIEEIIVGSALLASTLLITINVILRFFFGAGISWSDELVRYLIIVLTFVGSAICVRTGKHIAIDLLSGRLKGNKRNYHMLLINISGLIFMLAVAIFSIKIIQNNFKFPQLSPALQIPMWIPYLSIPIGFGLSSVRYVQEILYAIDDIRNNKKGSGE